jgi:hypothetical protein
LWLFGGEGYDSSTAGYLNDLWKFDGRNWTWVSGSSTVNQTGTYGTQATTNLSTGAATNAPGSRWGAAAWTDASSNFWLMGGWGYGTNATDPTGFLDDIWEYQQSSGQWIWWKGIANANQNTVFSTQNIKFALGAFYVNNVVGGRRGAAVWAPLPGPDQPVTIFGGEGYDASQGNPPGELNDFWQYLPFP